MQVFGYTTKPFDSVTLFMQVMQFIGTHTRGSFIKKNYHRTMIHWSIASAALTWHCNYKYFYSDSIEKYKNSRLY